MSPMIEEILSDENIKLAKDRVCLSQQMFYKKTNMLFT